MPAVRADEAAEKSPWRGREARIPCSCRYGRREPSRVISCIQQGIARPKRFKNLRVTPRGVTQTGPDRVDSGGTRSHLEGRGQHGPLLRTSAVTTRYLVRWTLSCMTLRGGLPCMRVPRSTTDASHPVRDFAPLFSRLKFILAKDGLVASPGG